MNFDRFLNFKNILIGVAIFAVVIAIFGFSGKLPIFNNSSKQRLTGTVRVWGTLSNTAMASFVDEFDKDAKTYTMNYTEVPLEEFNNKLLISLADGYPPDLIIAPVSIAFSNLNRIYYTLPSTIGETTFRNIYADIASNLIDMPRGYIALPISVDPLVLYYNRDILSSNGFVSPPTTWGDLYNYEEKITKKDSEGNNTLSTIAFGTYDNIPHITDIIMAMILQQGQNPISKEYTRDSLGNYSAKYTINMDEYNTDTGISPLNSSLAFTKDFADTQKPTFNWTPRSGSALNEFISGNLAFYIGFASEAGYIKNANQKLYFDYTLLPQILGSKVSATYGKLYVVFMLNTSVGASPSSLAYQVMQYFASPGKYNSYLVALTGGISVLKSEIANKISSGDQGAEIFGNSALISKDFYDLHRTDLERLMREAIRQVYNGEKSTVEASKIFADNLQTIYSGGN